MSRIWTETPAAAIAARTANYEPRSEGCIRRAASICHAPPASRQHPPSNPELDGRVVSWSRQDSRARDRLLETGERRARAFALDVLLRTRALNPPPSRRGFAFDASSPPRTAGSRAPTVQAPRIVVATWAPPSVARAPRSRSSRSSRFSRASPSRSRRTSPSRTICAAIPTVRASHPQRASPAEPIPARDATSHTFPASSRRRAARRAISARAPPSRFSSARHLPRSLARPSSLGSRPSVLVPRFSSLVPLPQPSSLLLTPRPPSLAPQIGTARRRTGLSARTSSRRHALPKRSTAT